MTIDEAYEAARDKYNKARDSIFNDHDFHAGFILGWAAQVDQMPRMVDTIPWWNMVNRKLLEAENAKLRGALERVDLELPIKLTYVKAALERPKE